MDILFIILNELALLGIAFIAAVAVITIHEYAHAFVSWRLGDKLPKFNRRLTLSPLPHIDIVGVLFFMLTGFGWGKPVETSPKHYKNKKEGTILVGISGSLASLAVAIFGCFILKVIEYKTLMGTLSLVGYAATYLEQFAKYLYIFSFNLAIISLIPMHPFDGFAVWGKLITPKSQFKFFQYQNVALTIFLILVLASPEILNSLISPIRNIIVGIPISSIVKLII